MSRSNNVDNFFQTDSNLADFDRKAAKAKNTNGNPIQLPSKILAITADPTAQNAVFVAESAGTVKRVDPDSREITHTYTGPSAPLTSLTTSPDGKTLYAGCWDKTIWSWDTTSQTPKTRFIGHTDFVKTVLCALIAGTIYLVSGGADAEILIWDIHSGQRVGTIRAHSRAVLDIKQDPENLDTPLLFSASSERNLRIFGIDAATSPSLKATEARDPILEHETSVNKLFFDADGDLWTASSDKSAKRLVRENGWKADTTLVHPDFVRDVVVHETGGWVVTACRDEEVRVWNRATGDLYHTFTGHFEEVTALALIGWTLISVSIDATIRTWSLKPIDLKTAKEEAEKEGLKEAEEKPQESLLTEEEERELAELMADDD